jgi:hypothetical protein
VLGRRPFRAVASGGLGLVSGRIQPRQWIAFHPIRETLVIRRAKSIYPELIGIVLSPEDAECHFAIVGFNSLLEKHRQSPSSLGAPVRFRPPDV